MIPKFHKGPYKYRFIADASNATTKRLVIDVNLCLKLIKRSTKATVKVYITEMVIITFGVWITLEKSWLN